MDAMEDNAKIEDRLRAVERIATIAEARDEDRKKALALAESTATSLAQLATEVRTNREVHMSNINGHFATVDKRLNVTEARQQATEARQQLQDHLNHDMERRLTEQAQMWTNNQADHDGFLAALNEFRTDIAGARGGAKVWQWLANGAMAAMAALLAAMGVSHLVRH